MCWRCGRQRQRHSCARNNSECGLLRLVGGVLTVVRRRRTGGRRAQKTQRRLTFSVQKELEELLSDS